MNTLALNKQKLRDDSKTLKLTPQSMDLDKKNFTLGAAAAAIADSLTLKVPKVKEHRFDPMRHVVKGCLYMQFVSDDWIRVESHLFPCLSLTLQIPSLAK